MAEKSLWDEMIHPLPPALAGGKKSILYGFSLIQNNMKTLLFTLLIQLCIGYAAAQSVRLVIDKEGLFTAPEEVRIDSVLRAYHNKSGNLVALYSDSADVSEESFGDRVEALFAHDFTDTAYSYILMLSRNHSLVISSLNKKTSPFLNKEFLMNILNAGIPSLKEKRLEEGVLLIFSEAMVYLDSLPKK